MVLHITPATRMSDLSEYFFVRANNHIIHVKQAGKDVIDLGIGSPDLLPHHSVIDALHTAVQRPSAHMYPPYNGLLELRRGIAAWYQRHHNLNLDPSTQIFPTAGSKQGIVHLMLALIDQGDKVLIPNPGYSTFEKGTKIAGGEVMYYQLSEESHFLPDLSAIDQLDLTSVKLMWLNYPNNPTGAVASLEDYRKILAFARRHHIIVANDNPYSHITFDGYKAPSLLEAAKSDDLVIEFNSLSKTYNIAGWRLGWAAGHHELIKLLSMMNSNIETGSFLPVQEAAITALELPDEWIEERNEIYAGRRTVVIELLEKLGCTVYPPSAALYVWAKLPHGSENSESFAFSLLERTAIFITPGTAFGSGGEGYLRASLCQSAQRIEEAIERI